MKFIQRLIDSFNCAIYGIVSALKTELNLKIHFLVTIFVLIVAVLFNISRLELISLLITSTLVIFAEMVNTAIEGLSDLITKDFHPVIKRIKDIAAGAVLITAINSLFIGYLLFFKDIKPLTFDLLREIQQTPIHLIFIALLLILMVIIFFKIFFNTGTPMQGGMPSGHSALAFGLMIIISSLAQDALVASLVLVLALLVAESRIEGKIHTPVEVISGGIIGLLVGLLVSRLL